MEKLLPLLKILVSKVASNTGGLLGWFYGRILFYGGQAFLDLVAEWARKFKREGVQKEKRKELEKVADKPGATPEEVGKAYEEYVNSGRS